MSMFIQARQLSLEAAKLLASAAEREAATQGWTIAVAVVDAGGHPVYLARMDGALLASYHGALMKASTAVMFGRETKVLEENVSRGRLHYFAFENTLPVSGGVPLVIDGETVGGIGIGGTNSAEASTRCVEAAIAVFNQLR